MARRQYSTKMSGRTDGPRASHKGLRERDGGGYRLRECVFCATECRPLVKSMEPRFRSLANNNVVRERDLGRVMDLVKLQPC